MRPKKTRWVACHPGEKCFRPKCKPVQELQGVILNLDEYEVLRLTHLEEYAQGQIAKQMKIHQSTISRILALAHKKVTDALVNNKAIRVKTGCCKIIKVKRCKNRKCTNENMERKPCSKHLQIG